MATLTTYPPFLQTGGIAQLPIETPLQTTDMQGGLRTNVTAANMVRKTRWERRKGNEPYNRAPAQQSGTEANVLTRSAWLSSGKDYRQATPRAGFHRNYYAATSGGTSGWWTTRTKEQQISANNTDLNANNAPGTAQLSADYQGKTDSYPYFQRVNGLWPVEILSTTPTTDELIQFYAAKWGLDEFIMRAEMMQESGWNQAFVGDKGNSDGSYGIGQVKRHDHAVTWPASAASTAWNLDYTFATVRATYDHKINYMRGTVATYRQLDDDRNLQPVNDDPKTTKIEYGYFVTKSYENADSIWLAMGTHFDGTWGKSTGQNYGDLIKDHLSRRSWQQSVSDTYIAPERTTDTSGGGGTPPPATSNNIIDVVVDASEAAASTFSIAKRTNAVQMPGRIGDYFVAFTSNRQVGMTYTATGWSQIPNTSGDESSGFANAQWLMKPWASGDDTGSFNFTMSASKGWAMTILLVRDLDVNAVGGVVQQAAVQVHTRSSGLSWPVFDPTNETLFTPSKVGNLVILGAAGTYTTQTTFPSAFDQASSISSTGGGNVHNSVGYLIAANTTASINSMGTIASSALVNDIQSAIELKVLPEQVAITAPVLSVSNRSDEGFTVSTSNHPSDGRTSLRIELRQQGSTVWEIILQESINVSSMTIVGLNANTTYEYRGIYYQGTTPVSAYTSIATVTTLASGGGSGGGFADIIFFAEKGGGGAGSTTGPFTVTPTYGQALAVGDPMYIGISLRSDSTTITPPTGFTLVDRNNITGQFTAMAVYKKRATATDVTNYNAGTLSFQYSFSSSHNSAWVFVAARGVDTTIDEDAAATQIKTTTASTTAVVPGITTVTDKTVLLRFVGGMNSATNITNWQNAGTGIVEGDATTSATTTIAVARKSITTGGTVEPNQNVTMANSLPSGGITLALRPARVIAIPGNVEVTNVKATQFRVQWEDTNAGQAQTEVELSTTSATSGFALTNTVNASINGVNLVNRLAGTNYWVRVRAKIGTNFSLYSPVIAFTTAQGNTLGLNVTGNVAENINPNSLIFGGLFQPAVLGITEAIRLRAVGTATAGNIDIRGVIYEADPVTKLHIGDPIVIGTKRTFAHSGTIDLFYTLSIPEVVIDPDKWYRIGIWAGNGTAGSIQVKIDNTQTTLSNERGSTTYNETATTIPTWAGVITNGQSIAAFVQYRYSLPSVVEVLSISELTSNTALLSWSKGLGATSYKVDWRIKGSTTWDNTVTITSVSHPLTNLASGTAYEAQVTSISSFGSSDPSGIISFTTSFPIIEIVVPDKQESPGIFEYRVDVIVNGVRVDYFTDFLGLAFTTTGSDKGSFVLRVDNNHRALQYVYIANDDNVNVFFEVWSRNVTMGIAWAWENSFHPRKARKTPTDPIQIEISGPDLNGMLEDRYNLYKADRLLFTKFENINAETVMKLLVKNNFTNASIAATGREADGNTTWLSLTSDQERGAIIPTRGNAWKNILNELVDLAPISGGDWMITRNATTGLYEFQFYLNQYGIDRTTNTNLLFSVRRGNMSIPEYIYDATGQITSIVAAGQGEEETRITQRNKVADKWIREGFYPTSEKELSALQAHAERLLKQEKVKETFTFKPIQTRQSLYRLHYNLGDIVLAEDNDRIWKAKIQTVRIGYEVNSGDSIEIVNIETVSIE